MPHSWKPTWTLKIMVWKRDFLSPMGISGVHASLRECTMYILYITVLSDYLVFSWDSWERKSLPSRGLFVKQWTFPLQWTPCLGCSFQTQVHEGQITSCFRGQTTPRDIMARISKLSRNIIALIFQCFRFLFTSLHGPSWTAQPTCPPVQPPVKRFKSLPSLGLIEDLNSDGTCEKFEETIWQSHKNLTKPDKRADRRKELKKKHSCPWIVKSHMCHWLPKLSSQSEWENHAFPQVSQPLWMKCLEPSSQGRFKMLLSGRSITVHHTSSLKPIWELPPFRYAPSSWAMERNLTITKAKGRQRFEFRKHEIREVLDTLHLTSAITKEEEGISRTLAIKNLWKIATNPNGCHQVSLQPPQVFAPVPLSASRGGHIKSWQSCRIIFHCFILLHIFMCTHHSASCSNKNHGKLKTKALPHYPCCIKKTNKNAFDTTPPDSPADSWYFSGPDLRAV